MANGVGINTPTPRVEVPKPTIFDGRREVRVIDDFLWEVTRYLKAMGIENDATKIHTTTMYLKDTAALWWRRRHGDIEKGTCAMQTFNEFVSDFKRQFYPENAIHEAKSRLRRLKQMGSIRGYVKEFTRLTLEIPDLSDDDALFYFLDGLSPRAKM